MHPRRMELPMDLITTITTMALRTTTIMPQDPFSQLYRHLRPL